MQEAKIRDIFDDVCRNVVADKALSLRIHRYVVDFINRNSEHSQFFGGNLTGVQVVRFVESDKNHWFDDILDVNEHDLQDKINKLACVQGKDGVRHVSGDALNQSCVWLCYKFHNASNLTIDERAQTIQDILLALQFKFLTSRLFRHFKFPADRASAEAAYAQLSNKYSIKIYGTWLKVLEARCSDITAKTSSHFNVIARMDDDMGVVRMLNDIQGRLRDMLKNIFGQFVQIKDAGEKITSSSGVVDFDGVEVLKDRSKGLATYTNYMNSVVGDKNSFIRGELLKVVQDIFPSAPPKHIVSALEYISNNYLKSRSDDIAKLIEMTMIHSFTYLEKNRQTVQAGINLPKLLERLRGVYTSSRSTDPDLMDLRRFAEVIVRKSVDTRTDSVIASVRTAVLLYIVSRAYTMCHWSNV